MNVAQQFMNQLQEGKTTEAIKTIKEALHERSAEKIQEEKQDILESYGFVVKEARGMNSDTVVNTIKNMMNDVDKDEADYLKMLADRVAQTYPDSVSPNDLIKLSKEPQVKKYASKVDWSDLIQDIKDMV